MTVHEHTEQCPPGTVAYQPPPPPKWQRWTVGLWSKPGWLAPLAVLGCLGLAFGYVLANDPTDDKADPLGPCLFKAVTGLDCPGCGGTRMVWYLLHGDLGQAARHHLIALLAVPVLAYAYLAWAAKRMFGFSLPTWQVPPPVWGGYLAAWAVFAVVRNLPWAPAHYFYVS